MHLDLKVGNGALYRLYARDGKMIGYFICPSDWAGSEVNKLLSTGIAATAVRADE